MKKMLKIQKTMFILLAFIVVALPRISQAESRLVDYDGAFVILINDLITVNDQGVIVTHVTKQDASLNIQAKIKGTVRADKTGLWHFKKGQIVTFPSAKMYLTNDITTPVTLEVLTDELDEKTETQHLPVLIKGVHDPVGQRFHIRINGNMLAGVLVKP